MPGMDGYEVCQRLKADPRWADIPVIFISALNDVDGIVKALNIGGADYITKPFRSKEVLARVSSQMKLLDQRRQIEALREQDRQHFERLNEMKSQFIHMATHDLKNPLTIIGGYAEMLEDLDVAENQQAFFAQSLQAIQDGVEKMRTLVAEMLDLAQLDTGVGLTLAPHSLTPFIEKCAQAYGAVAQRKGIDLAVTPPLEDLTVVMDQGRMERVMDNLLSNAIKYTSVGGRVELRAGAADTHVLIQVSDTGLGIPAKDIPHLFEAFFRVREAEHRQAEGTGLGLTLVKLVVEQHGGRVFVESAPGEGSTFSVQLPLDLVSKLG
jgi:two-component system sensor histidine kinase/response regulator